MTVLNYQGIAPLGVMYTFLMFNPSRPGVLAISNNETNRKELLRDRLHLSEVQIAMMRSQRSIIHSTTNNTTQTYYS